LVRIGALRERVARTSFAHGIDLLGHAEFAYPARVRRAILAAMNADQARVAELAASTFFLASYTRGRAKHAKSGSREG